MLKQQKLAAVVAIGVLTVVGITSSLAVHINPDGTGQVLIFPYFNANSGYVTNINLVNSSDQTKAIKVRFREGKASDDVLSFNIYMSPWDVWTGSIHNGKNDVGTFTTTDRTCALPLSATASCNKQAECEMSKPFQTQGVNGSIATADTREGYVEVIEMGVVTDTTLQAAAKHTNGKPADCSALAAAWTNKVNKFKPGVGANAVGLAAPTGGLFGSSAVLNIAEGAAFAIDPVAIDNYSTQAQHYRADISNEYLLPSLASGNVTQSSVMIQKPSGETEMVVTDWNTQADACLAKNEPACGTNPYPVAHVLTSSYIMNEYFVDPTDGYDGHTDWVVSFPMKKHGIMNQTTDVMASFENDIYDREEASSATMTSKDYFGFTPPVGVSGTSNQKSVLEREVNVITFATSDPSYDSDRSVLSSPSALTMGVGPFVHGWARMTFSGYSLAGGFKSAVGYGPNPATYDSASYIYQGVPVLGAAFLEGNVSSNEHARFGDALPHKTQHY